MMMAESYNSGLMGSCNPAFALSFRHHLLRSATGWLGLAQAPISPTAFFPQNLGNSVNCTVKGWKGQSQREPKAQIDRVTISHTSLDRVSPGCLLIYTMFPECLEIAKWHKAQ
jgi:hypothetical protein